MGLEGIRLGYLRLSYKSKYFCVSSCLEE